MTRDYYVGQELLIDDVNRRDRPLETCTVTKVGRKLVTVAIGQWGREEVYRIDTSKRNDNYQHRWLLTREEYEDRERRRVLLDALRKRYIEVSTTNLTIDQLQRILDIAEEER